MGGGAHEGPPIRSSGAGRCSGGLRGVEQGRGSEGRDEEGREEEWGGGRGGGVKGYLIEVESLSAGMPCGMGGAAIVPRHASGACEQQKLYTLLHAHKHTQMRQYRRLCFAETPTLQVVQVPERARCAFALKQRRQRLVVLQEGRHAAERVSRLAGLLQQRCN
jgi:hypothetical protein